MLEGALDFLELKCPRRLVERRSREDGGGVAVIARSGSNQVQFSTRRPETRRNSFTLLVTSTNAKDRACPAIMAS